MIQIAAPHFSKVLKIGGRFVRFESAELLSKGKPISSCFFIINLRNWSLDSWAPFPIIGIWHGCLDWTDPPDSK